MDVKTIAKVFAMTLAANTAFATPEGWMDDFDAAKAQAAKEGKLLLVDFSGSDWCCWCHRLDEEVFSKKEFVDEAQKDFVLVMIDEPNDKSKLSEKAKSQNPELIKKYNIRGFPSVLIMDADGVKLKKTGYRKGGPEAYLKHLSEAKAAVSLFEDLKKSLEGLEKGSAERIAKIDEFLQKIGEKEAEDHEELVKELLANDKDGKFALKYPHFAFGKPAEAKVSELFTLLNGEMHKRLDSVGHKPGKDEIRKVRKEVDVIAREKLPEVKKAVEAIKASAPDSAKAEIDRSLHSLEMLEEQLNEKDEDDGKGNAQD